MIVSCDNYESIKVDDMDIENEKYNDIGDSYLRKDLFGELGDLFSDDKIYTVQYIEALGGVDPHPILGFIIKIIKISYSMTIYQMMLNLR